MNANKKKAKGSDALFDRWRSERDKAVASLDVEKFKAFIKKWQMLGAYAKKQLPPDNVVEITMYKMACEITSMPESVALKAAEWLVERGYVAGIEWDKEESKNDGTNAE